MPLDFITSGYVLSGFLFVLGFVHLWVASETSLGGKTEKRFVRKVVSLKSVLVIFGIFYVALGFLFLFTTYGNSLFLTYEAPCENVVSNSTYNGNVTVYAYIDSCASKEVPVTVERLYTILGWAWALQLILASLAVFVGIALWVMRW